MQFESSSEPQTAFPGTFPNHGPSQLRPGAIAAQLLQSFSFRRHTETQMLL